MNDNIVVYLTFEKISPSKNSLYIQEFLKTVREIDNNIKVEIINKDETQTSMDAGDIISIVLAAPTLVVIAKGIANWISKNQSEITITDGNKKIVIKNTNVNKIIPLLSEFIKKIN